MTRKRPDVQLCGERHERYLHCLVCNPPPPERPERVQGPRIGARVMYRNERYGGPATVTEQSYVWAPGDPSYRGGSRRYDWKVITLDSGKRLCVDDKDLESLEGLVTAYRADWLAELFEDEYCAECGGDTEHHTVVPFIFGNPFARCDYPPIDDDGTWHPTIAAFRREAADV